MSRPVGRLGLSTLFGMVMTAAVAVPAGPAGRGVAVGAAVAVLVAVFWRPAALAAVLACVVAAAVSGPSALSCAAAGFAAAAYLVTRHAAGAEAAAVTPSTVIGLGVFTLAGLLPAVVPLRLTWAPLLAPAVVVAILALTALLLARPADGPVRPD